MGMALPISLVENILTFKDTFVFKKENKDNWRPVSFKFIYLIIHLETVFPRTSGRFSLRRSLQVLFKTVSQGIKCVVLCI